LLQNYRSVGAANEAGYERDKKIAINFHFLARKFFVFFGAKISRFFGGKKKFLTFRFRWGHAKNCNGVISEKKWLLL